MIRESASLSNAASSIFEICTVVASDDLPLINEGIVMGDKVLRSTRNGAAFALSERETGIIPSSKIMSASLTI